MRKDELNIGDYVFLKSIFNPQNPIEVLFKIEELEEDEAICTEVDLPDERRKVSYQSLLPVDFTLHTLNLLGFEKFKSPEQINDFAGFVLFTFQGEKYAFDNRCLYKFRLETIIRAGKSYLTVVPIGDCFRFFHKLQKANRA